MKRTGTARPFVFINMAMTADGKIATENRAVSSFGSQHDREHLYELRARADAIMAGARTVDTNPVTLGPGGLKFRRLRVRAGLSEYPARIVVSRTGSLRPAAEVFKRRFSPIIVLTTEAAGKRRIKALSQAADEVRVCGEREIDFWEALVWLRQHRGIRKLLCEGGGELNDALFRAGVVDELHLTVCPFIFGGRRAPTIADGDGAESLAAAAQMKLHAMRRKGEEVFLVYRANRKTAAR